MTREETDRVHAQLLLMLLVLTLQLVMNGVLIAILVVKGT